MPTKATVRDLNATIQELEQERSELKERLAEIESEIATLRSACDIMNKRVEDADAAALPTKEIRNNLVEILKEAGHPLHYAQLYELLLGRDIQVPGKDPLRNVSAHLSNDPRFKPFGNGAWGLTSWPRSRSTTEQGERDRRAAHLAPVERVLAQPVPTRMSDPSTSRPASRAVVNGPPVEFEVDPWAEDDEDTPF